MATPTTIDNDTELSAVNSILGSIGQSPVTTLNFTNPETEFIYNILTEVSKDVQNEGWQFNLEENVTVTPSSNKISVGNQEIRVNIHSHANQAKLMDTVIRYDGANRRVYSLEENKFDAFTETSYKIDVVTLYLFERIPNVF